ncbi:NHL domain-containing protein [Wolffia australiana]
MLTPVPSSLFHLHCRGEAMAMAALSPPFFLFLFFLPLAGGRHVVTFNAAKLRPSSLAWDPSAQHFIVGSAALPVVSAVSDAGVVQTLIADPALPAGAALSAIALDHRRRLLFALVAAPTADTAIAAYDLRHPPRRLFLTPIPSAAAIAAASAPAAAFVAAGRRLHRVDLNGSAAVVAELPLRLAAIARGRDGYLLTGSSGGKLFRFDSGAAKEVLGVKVGELCLAVRKDGALVAAGGGRVRVLVSGDGWAEAGVRDEAVVGGGRREAAGVAARERGVYVLSTAAKEGEEGEEEEVWIEEVEWDGEREGEWVVGMVLVGLGLAYFAYWRFQMGRLISHMNKKIA